MKQWFIYLSTLLIAIYLIWGITTFRQQLQYFSYPSVYVQGTKEGSAVVDREVLTQNLSQLAEKNDSIIARRIVEPNKEGKVHFTYEAYGCGELPEGLIVAESETAKASDPAGSYLIVKGELSAKTVADFLNKQGYEARKGGQYSVLGMLFFLISGSYMFLAILMFILTFAALTLITRIKELRYAGVRRMDGEKLSSIIIRAVWADSKNCLMAMGALALVGSGGLLYFRIWYVKFYFLLWLGLFVYQLSLLGISGLLVLVYIIGLKRMSLVSIIKGKLPLKSLVGILLTGQLLALVFVGFLAEKSVIYYQLLQAQRSAEKDWEKQQDWVNISFNEAAFQATQKQQDIRDKMWYAFIKEEVEENQALLVKHNLINIIGATDKEKLTDYFPGGNTIYVTPNYLEYQKIRISPETRERLNHLKEGEFGLLLPEKLKEQTDYYKAMYTDDIMKYRKGSAEDGIIPAPASAIVDYTEGEQSYFIYNNTSISAQQYVKEPIIVVVTPVSMGQTIEARRFWTGMLYLPYLFLKNYDNTIALLKKHNTYVWVSYIKDSAGLYYKQFDRIRTEVMASLAACILGIVTSVLLFRTMNLLYFEQFRREIFIKRISGMKFGEIHLKYFMCQLLILLIGFIMMAAISRNRAVALTILFLFIGNAFILAYRQMQAENKTAVTVLKGK
ncbi:bacteriocin-associated integral membrane family protein [Clostridiales bacterium COT073_COT-073]|nr:bacteriocin-associated integral membrane family protein [Clostridiales bacterium COT073_COT-073]